MTRKDVFVGWLSWAPDRAFIGAMDWLWGLLGAVGIVLVLGAYLAVRAARQLSASLARSIATIRQLTTQDVLTGLPNRRVMLERLDEVIATRGPSFVAFALLDIDGFHDINTRWDGRAATPCFAEHRRTTQIRAATRREVRTFR